MFSRRLIPWQASSVALAAIEGTIGLWLSVKTDARRGDDRGSFGPGLLHRGARAPAAAARCDRRRRGGLARGLGCGLRRLGRRLGKTKGDRHDDPDRRSRAPRRWRRGRGRPDPAAQHRPARVRAAPERHRECCRGQARLRQRRQPGFVGQDRARPERRRCGAGGSGCRSPDPSAWRVKRAGGLPLRPALVARSGQRDRRSQGDRHPTHPRRPRRPRSVRAQRE